MPFKIATCRSCGARIVWATTAKGKAMPVDADPSENGNVELTARGTQPPLATVHAQPPLGATELRMPHHATCPQGKDWKR